jgi:hypothetical protein
MSGRADSRASGDFMNVDGAIAGARALRVTAAFERRLGKAQG